MDSKNAATIIKTYTRLGWYYKGKNRFYLASKLLSQNKVYKNYRHANFEKFEPKGSFQAWREGLIPFIQRPTIALALIIGASAIVVPILKETGCFNSSLIFALIGKSSTFKTTAMKLMASIYGKPEIGVGVIDTMLDTTNFFYNQLGSKNGYPHFIDDISAAYGHDFTNEIYNVSMGKGRGRLNPDGTPRKIENWCTTVVYTGESSILAQTNENLGLYARLIELSFQWLSDDDDVDSFYDVINRNYGMALEPLVNLIFSLSDEEIRTIYREMQNWLYKNINPSKGIGERIVNTYAVLMTTLILCNKAWELELKIENVLPLLEETYAKNIAIEDPVTLMIDALKEQIVTHNSMFPSNSSNKAFFQDAWGVRGTYKERNCVWVMENKMKELAKAAGIQSIKDVQKEFADRGFLVRDPSNHYTFSKIIRDGIKTACYGVYTTAESQQPKPSTKKVKIAVTHKNITKPDLLADADEKGIPP